MKTFKFIIDFIFKACENLFYGKSKDLSYEISK